HIGLQLAGKTVAIVGFGRIGRRVAGLLHAFDARVIAVDPSVSGIVEGVPAVPLEEALPVADVITVHASGSDEILGARELEQLKRGTFIMNAGRGELVNESALCRALDSGTVAGA